MAAISGLALDVTSGSDGATITTSNSTFSAVSGTPEVDTGWAVAGSRSARFTTATAGSETGRLQAAAPVSTAYMAGPIRLWARPTGSNVVIVNLVDNSNVVCAQVQHLTNGTLRMRRADQSAVGTVSAAMPVNGEAGATGEYWLEVQVVSAATMRARLRPLGSDEVLWDSGNLTYTGTAFQRISLGIGTSAVADISFDSWDTDDSSMPAQPVEAPTVDAGEDVSLKDGQSVTLDSTITGTTTSEVWSVDDGPSLSDSQFSSTSDDDPTFTPDGGPGTYTLRRTANWSGGSVSATVRAVVAPLTGEFTVTSVTGSGWTATGGADTLTEAVTDLDNATAARSPDSPSASVVRIYLDGGLKPAAGQAWTLPVRLKGPADSAFVASLLRHNDSTVVHANSSVDIDSGDAVDGESDMYDHVISFAAADWASMPDADWVSGPVVTLSVSE